MLTVEKIGGTSMSRFKDVLENIILSESKKKDPYNRVFVVSAYSGVTNLLLEHKKTGEKGIYAKFASLENYQAALEDLITKLKAINRELEPIGLDLQEADRFIEKRVRDLNSYLDSMSHVISSGYISRDNILLAGREMLASIGEVHSAYNSAMIINANGAKADFVDLSGFYDADMLTIDERIRKTFKGIDTKKSLAIVTGYTKGTEGIMREYDRGYSEVTFSKIAVELKANEAVIHKEFHLSSADPQIVGLDKSVPVGKTNFDVADQLADIGMEAIHPKASKPIELAGIDIRLKNTFDPEHPGTLITKDYIGSESRIEIITGSKKVAAVEVHDPAMVGTVGFDLHIMEIFLKYGVSYILKTTNANSITHLIWERSVTNDFIDELKNKYELVSIQEAAVVCVIGSNIAKPGVLENATRVLAEKGININCLSQSLRQVNIQFVIDRKDYSEAIIALNQRLCVEV